ncbi:MAG: tetratricopeptide repeat protein [Acidobacteriota bacterium]
MKNPARRAQRASQLLALGATLLIVGLLATPAVAQLPGGMFGLITDENGDPVPNVTITIKDPERPSFEQVVESNKKGRYKIHLANATVPYSMTFSAPGFQTFSVNGVKVTARQDTRKNFEMKSQAAAQAAAAAAPAAGGAADVDPEAAAKGGAVETFNKGVQATQSGDLDTAIMLFEAALEKDAELGMAHAALARVHLDKEDHTKAAAAAEKAIALDADPDSMQQVLYSSYSALGQADKAQAALTKMQGANPEAAAKNIFNQAAGHYNNGNMAEAKKGFEQLMTLDPNHAKGNYLLGIVYIGEGNNAGAKEKLEKFLELAPNDPDAATAKEMLTYIE